MTVWLQCRISSGFVGLWRGTHFDFGVIRIDAQGTRAK